MYIYIHVHAHTHTPVILCVMCMINSACAYGTPNGMGTPGGLHSEWFKANFEASYLIAKNSWCLVSIFPESKGVPSGKLT